MTLRDRILTVYRGDTPDVVPAMLDLSHWWLHRQRLPWDLAQANTEPEADLIAFHRDHGVGYYLPTICPFYSTRHTDGVVAEVTRGAGRPGPPELTWSYHTPLGSISRSRLWDERTYSWHIRDWGVQTEQDLRVLAHALAHREFEPQWDHYHQWLNAVGDTGVVCLSLGYSAIGYLMSLWMGVERTHLLAYDQPELLAEVVAQINEANLRLIDLAGRSPAEIILLGDNFSSDIQPPSFFARWSREHYAEATRRLHAAGKFVAVHVDGRLRGLLAEMAAIGVDCIDAVTPSETGDLTPEQCRQEAGPDLILSGGLQPALWLPGTPREAFTRAVHRWLDLRHQSPRLIAATGDQVPPGAEEGPIRLFAELVEEFGRYD